MTLVRSLSSTHLCPVESQYPLRIRQQRRDTAERIQALWRGYKTRQKQMEEMSDALSLWKRLDHAYRLCVACQTLASTLHRGDPFWDPETPWYIWMLTQGRYLESLEIYLQQRGWVRPSPPPSSTLKDDATREVYWLYRKEFFTASFQPHFQTYKSWF